MSYKNKENQESAIYKFGSGLSLFFIGLAIILFLILLFPTFVPEKYDYSQLSSLGSTATGFISPIVAISAAMLTFLAFWVQYKANEQQKNDITIQRFESIFFEMIRLHKENVNEMKISGYGVLLGNSLEKENGNVTKETESKTQTERFVEGRKVFVSMIKELNACYGFCQEYKSPTNNKELLKIGYRLFFFGSVSSSITPNEKDSDIISKLRIKLKEIRDDHKKELGLKTTFKDIQGDIDLHIKYAPYTGHESRLAHYYRHLFNTVKYVVDKEKKGVFDYQQSREYLKILRAQMSNDEQLMLYYNYINGMGSKWEDEENKFFSHYRMLHNLPINRVRFVENPRIHFKKQIKEIESETNGSEQMFESDTKI